MQAFFGPIGNLYANALRIVVAPLAASLLITGVADAPSGRGLGRWAWITPLAFGVVLLAGGLLTWLATNLLPPVMHVDVPPGPATPAANSLGAVIESLIPANLFDALTKGDLLPIVVMAIIFGFAVRALADNSRRLLLDFIGAVRDALLAYVRWVVALLVIGAFSLAFVFAAKSGANVAGPILQLLVFDCAILLALTLLLYPVAVYVGQVRWKRFAVSALPAQEVAVSTRSSLAALPAAIDSAEAAGLSEGARSFFLPLAASIFRPNRTVTGVSRVIVVAAATGVVLGPGKVMVFIVTVMLLSLATPGLPGITSGSTTMGAYVAAGLSPQAIILFDSVDAITDILKTLYNVTAYLATAAVTNRFRGDALDQPPEAQAAAQ